MSCQQKSLTWLVTSCCNFYKFDLALVLLWFQSSCSKIFYLFIKGGIHKRR